MGAAKRTERFEALIRRNGPDLSRYFQRRLLNGADAAEAYGELLLTAWKIRRKMPVDEADGRMWLFATARNVVLNTRRTLARRSAAVQRLIDDTRSMSAPASGFDSAAEVRDAIASLAPDDAELVRLVYWDGLRSHEAATVLRINPSTARSRLSSAKRQLRALLEPVTTTTPRRESPD
ncbi:RNA polymerase sigma factor [Microbacterium foliorum]|uniref:RNA polymerase sigma factor n=1 Tax=Microbacterium foliorum TaxID=104336 RepID=UPI00209FE961|nr:sigma-70 family RNA polymerase sigma factor [Microbacterium foliorum]